MGAFLRWIVERRLLTLVGFGVILLGAFAPWPSLAISAVVIVLGAVLLAVQIPIAMRDATEQLDGFDEPAEEWQSPTYPQYQAPAQSQPEPYSTPPYEQPQPVIEPAPAAVAPAARVPEPLQAAPSRPMFEPAPVWQPQNIPLTPLSQPARPMYEPAPVFQPQKAAEPQQLEPSPQGDEPAPGWKVGEPAPAWRPKNIPQQR